MAHALSRKVRTLQEQEALEPMMAWGLRMVLALLVPLLLGIAMGHGHEGEWIALTAESLCWVELKGSVGQRIRVVVGGIVLCLFFSLLGMLSAGNIWLATGAMLAVGFFSGLFKNLGDRGSGLAICVYVLFILNNFIPVEGANGIPERLLLTFVGGIWYFLLAMAFSVGLRHSEPYRRSLGLIWKSIAGLTGSLAQGWDGRQARSRLNAVYKQETAVRKALDTSIEFHSGLAHQVDSRDTEAYNLALIRKATALTATQIVAAGEVLEGVSIQSLPPEIRNLFYGLYRTLEQAARRLSTYTVSLMPEENLLLANRLSRADELSAILESRIESTLLEEILRKKLLRANALLGRSSRQMQTVMRQLDRNIGEKPVYRSYSLAKTIYVLRPAYFLESLSLLFNYRSENFRYALRVAVAAGIAMLFAQTLRGSHTYWIPFTVILISQPHLGATVRKGTDRVIGTVAGGVVGGLLLLVPDIFLLQIVALGLSSFFMVYYIRKNYAVAAFFITVSLVMLIDVESGAGLQLVFIRALNTAVGSAIAILASFLLLPVWDRQKLPENLENAFRTNMQYLEFTLAEADEFSWTRMKRQAEQANLQAFESLQRYMDEPDVRSKSFIQPYQLLTFNVRLTRDLNQIHLEREHQRKETAALSESETHALLTHIGALRTNILHQYGYKEQVAYLPTPKTITVPEAEHLQKMLTEMEGIHQALLRRQTVGVPVPA